MIGDKELIEVYIKPYHGIKNPNLYIELPSSSSPTGTVGEPMGLLLALTYSS